MSTIVASGARLDRLPICAFHRRLLWLIGAGMFLDGFEVYLAGGVIGLLIKTGWTDMASAGGFISAGVFGMVLGAWFSGILGDRFGRRFSYQLNLLIFGLASFAAAAAPSMPWLVAARFVMGIGLGAEIVVGYATLIEYVPPTHRGRWGAGLSLFMNAALFASAISGYFVLPMIGWRSLFVAVGVAALGVWYLRKGVPESPRWLEQKGRNVEAEAIVAGIEAEAGVGRSALPPAPSAPPAAMHPLFSREMVARFAMGFALNIGGNAAVYGFIVWLPSFFVKQGLTITSSLGFTAIMSLGGPVGAAIGMLVADRFNRKRMIVGLSVLAALLGFAYPFADSNEWVALNGFALVTVIYVFVAVAWASYVPELFPTEIRLRAAGYCNAVGRLVAAAMPFAVVPLFTRFGVVGVVSLLGAILLIQAVVVAALGIETNRRSLEALAPEETDQAAMAVREAPIG
ncbi:MFS transporter [Aliidongia dinghuensis]|uniref:MFS transporter n=1 Tax=Aliidongia dinghuensis TaxID=1867774 RepID=A0A8J3E1W3_9PROT|nr:MFS transporter [Aliidongia dinghuensis]GGF04794.1 MFS transporter [Aliidongia dinghuensis]